MKAVLALALAGAAAAIPAGWQDAPETPVKVTSTTPAAAESTWADEPAIKTTTPVADETAHTWEDVSKTPSVDTTTSTWADYTVTTPVADASSTWGDYSVPVKETTSTVTAITTYCPKPTTFTDKGDVYTVTEATTLTLTKGPYTVTIPIYEETSTVCEGSPVAPTGAASTWVDVPAPAGPTGGAAKPSSPVSPAVPEKPSGEQPVSPYTGSASKMAGAGLAGVAAVAALLL